EAVEDVADREGGDEQGGVGDGEGGRRGREVRGEDEEQAGHEQVVRQVEAEGPRPDAGEAAGGGGPREPEPAADRDQDRADEQDLVPPGGVAVEPPGRGGE